VSLSKTEVSELYVAIFGRPSERGGSEYWSNIYYSASIIADGMLNDPSAIAYFGESINSNQAFIEHIYFNTFGRTLEDDPTGIAFWVSALDAGYSRGFIVTEMITALKRDEPNDSPALNQFLNRVEVSNYYADEVEEGLEESYFKDDGLQVTDDTSSVTTAKLQIDDIVIRLDETAPHAMFSLKHSLIEIETDEYEFAPQITQTDSDGSFAVAWYCEETIFIQNYHANGLADGERIQLDLPVAPSNQIHSYAQITSIGNTGTFVATWAGEYNEDGYFDIHVQSFNADGTLNGTIAKLESWVAIDPTSAPTFFDGLADQRQITVIGDHGDFVISWISREDRIYKAYIQKFNADGTTSEEPTLLGQSNSKPEPKVFEIDDEGNFIATWYSKQYREGYEQREIHIQSFNYDGSIGEISSSIEVNSEISFYSYNIITIDQTGAAVLTLRFEQNLYLQSFNADGSENGTMVEISGTDTLFEFQTTEVSPETFVISWSNIGGFGSGLPYSINVQPLRLDGLLLTPTLLFGEQDILAFEHKITAIGNDGEFILSWRGSDNSSNGTDIYVQKFDKNGALIGPTIELEAYVYGYADYHQTLSSAQNDELIIVWAGNRGENTASEERSVFIQKLNQENIPLQSDNFIVQSSELGIAYVVHDTISVSTLEDITNADDNLWNSVEIIEESTDTLLSASGLVDGSYYLYSTDLADNLSAASTASITVSNNNVDTSIVVFDLTSGNSSDHSERTFEDNVDYTIYLFVDADQQTLNNSTEWRGASNLGAGDKIILVGDGAVIGQGSGVIDGTNVNNNNVNWTTVDANLNAVQLYGNGNLDRFFQTVSDSSDIWTGTANFSLISFSYATEIPVGVLTSQGLV
jgi:hypothetical protein